MDSVTELVEVTVPVRRIALLRADGVGGVGVGGVEGLSVHHRQITACSVGSLEQHLIVFVNLFVVEH